MRSQGACSRKLRRSKALPVFDRRHGDPAHECSPQAGLIGKSAHAGDLLQRGVAFLQHAPCRFDTSRLDEVARCHVRLPLEEAGEVAGAHGQARRQRLDREVVTQVVQDPFVYVADRADLGNLGLEMDAELGLAAGPLEEEDEFLRHAKRGAPAVVLFDQCKREVHARGDPGRCIDVAILYVDGVRLEPYEGKLLRQPRGRIPMRRRPPAVQQSGIAKQEGARADRAEPADVAGTPGGSRRSARDGPQTSGCRGYRR